MNNIIQEKHGAIDFGSFPTEIRHKILTYTPLVCTDGGIIVRHGRLVSLIHAKFENGENHFSNCACAKCCQPFVGMNLLNVTNKAFREDAYHVCFSHNELVFWRHPEGHLRFFQSNRQWARHIRRMQFIFSEYQIDQWITGGERLCGETTITEPGTGPPALDQTWIRMVGLIKELVPLETLLITLSAWEAREFYLEVNADETVLPNVLDSYKSIVAPFRGWGQQGLRGFACVWALFLEYESEAEQEVMGNGYTPFGKLSPDSRY